jgi:hypothetical protein
MRKKPRPQKGQDYYQDCDQQSGPKDKRNIPESRVYFIFFKKKEKGAERRDQNGQNNNFPDFGFHTIKGGLYGQKVSDLKESFQNRLKIAINFCFANP